MPESPLVSILCISMNHAAFIENSFLSAVNQTYANKEILFVDNFSTDQSFEIGLQVFQNSGVSYQAFKREKNYGISENLNFLIAKSKGKYITFLSADDWWDNENLNKKIPFFEQNPGHGLLHGAGFIHNYSSGKISVEKPLNTKSGWMFSQVIKRNFINTIGVIIRKEVFDDLGYFDESSPIEDWDMWIRIAGKYQILFYPEPLVYYGKRSGENLSDDKAFMKKGYQYIFHKYAHRPEIAEARRFYALMDVYEQARLHPNMGSFRLLLRNFQFTFLHLRQMARCGLGIMGVLKKN
jgi:glycosyltransferase involved in cell wall biosynthesis